MEEFRARDEGNATFFSPGKVRQLKDLQQAREDEKEQQQLDKVARAQEKEREKAVKAQKLAERRLERQKKAEQKKEALTARFAAKAAAKAAKEAAKQLGQDIQASPKRREGRTGQLKRAHEPHDDRMSLWSNQDRGCQNQLYNQWAELSSRVSVYRTRYLTCR